MEARPRLRVLVVDDNEANRAFATAAMEDEGFEVEAVASADEALTAFATLQPDCVLLDLKMPDKDGFVACRELRALPGGRSTAILFVTAVRNAEAFDQAVHAGGDDFITKPVMANELVARACAAIRAKALSQGAFAIHAVSHRYRMELMQLEAWPSLPADGAADRTTLDELCHHVDRMLAVSGDLARGALEESIAGQSAASDLMALTAHRS